MNIGSSFRGFYNGITNFGNSTVEEVQDLEEDKDDEFEVIENNSTLLPQANQPSNFLEYSNNIVYSHLMYRTEGYLGRQEEKVISFPVTVAGFYRVVVKNTLIVHVPNVHFTINLKCGRETDFKEVLYANEEWKSHGMVISNLTEEERAQNDARSDDETWTRTISVTLKSHVKLGLKHAQYSVCIFSEFEKTYFEEGPITEDETRMIDVQVPRGIYKIFIGSEVRGQNLDVQVQSDVYGTHEPSLKKGTHNMICSKYFAVFKEKSPLLVRITIQGKVFLHNKPGKYKVIIARAHNSEIEVDTCEEFNRIANELMDATNTKDGDAICDIMQNQWKPIAKSFQSAFLQHDMEKVTQMAELLRVELLTLIRDASEIIPENPRGEADPVQVADMKVRIDNFLMESKELSKLSKRAKKFLRFRAKKAQVKQLMKGVLDKLSDVVETKTFASWTDSSLLPQIYEQLQDVITETMSRFGSDPDQEIQADLMVLKTVNVTVGNQIKLQSQLDTILHTDNINQIQSFLSRNEQQLARDAYERGVEHVRNLKIQQIPVIVIPKEEPTVVTPTTEPIVASDQPKRKRSIYEKQLANALAEKKKKLLEESKLASTVYYQSPMTPMSPPEAVESEIPTSHEQTCKQLHTKLIDLMKLASQFVERTQNGKLIVYFEYPFAESIDQIVRFFTTMLTVHRQYRKKKSFFSFHKKEEEEMEIIPVKEIIRGLSAEGSSFVKEFEKLSEVKQVSNEEQFDVTSLMVQYALHTDILGTLLTQLMHHNTRKYRSTMYDLYSIFNAYDPDTLMAVFGLLESLKFTFEFFNRDSNLEKFFSRVKKINIVDDSKSITLDPEMKPKTATSPTNVQQMVTLLKKTQESTKKIVRYFLHGKKLELGNEKITPQIGQLIKVDLVNNIYEFYKNECNTTVMEYIRSIQANWTDAVMTSTQLEEGLNISSTYVLDVFTPNPDYYQFVLFISYCINLKLLCAFIRASTNKTLLDNSYGKHAVLRNQALVEKLVHYLQVLEKLPIVLEHSAV